MTEAADLRLLWSVRVAGVLAAVGGVGSWWTGYWTGLTAALAGFVLAGVLVFWADQRRRPRYERRGLPVLAVVLAVAGWVVFFLLTFVRSRTAGAALGVSSLAIAWIVAAELPPQDDRAG
jgi:peptidoglycan/LPS O-acetylase OafA/YrhL